MMIYMGLVRSIVIERFAVVMHVLTFMSIVIGGMMRIYR